MDTNFNFSLQRKYRTKPLRNWGFGLGVLLFAIILLSPGPSGLDPMAWKTAAVAALMATWWVTEAIPIPATSLVPIALFPLLGVMKPADLLVNYANQNIYLFMGGFFIAMAMQKWNLHKRIALNLINMVGCSPKRLVFGFMVSTAFISMWVSNTATTMMMLPIGVAVILEAGKLQRRTEDAGGRSSQLNNFGIALMLGIAYAASIGGVCTLVGTPPNIVFAGQAAKMFPEAPPVTFAGWLKIGLPLGLILIPVTWFYLVFISAPLREGCIVSSVKMIRKELVNLGPMSRGEKYTFMVFVLTALLWIFRVDIVINDITIPGWSRIAPYPSYINDSTVAIFMSLILFILPVDISKGEYALDWEWARKIPWGILILFGGGFALADGFKATGLADWIGSCVGAHLDLGIFGTILFTCLLITFLTEITSNTATATMMMPVMATTAVHLNIHPYLLMIPATISASFAFMLPVATPPNAIVFSSGYISISKMAKTGFWLNLIGVAVASIIVYKTLSATPWLAS